MVLYGKANRKGHWRKGLVTVFVIHVFTMGCILSCRLLPDGGTETAVPLLPWKSSETLDIKRIDLFVHERLCFWACAVFIPMRSDTRPVYKMLMYVLARYDTNRTRVFHENSFSTSKTKKRSSRQVQTSPKQFILPPVAYNAYRQYQKKVILWFAL